MSACTKLCPERFSFRRCDVHTEQFAPSVVVNGNGDDNRNRDDASAFACLYIGGVDVANAVLAARYNFRRLIR